MSEDKNPHEWEKAFFFMKKRKKRSGYGYDIDILWKRVFAVAVILMLVIVVIPRSMKIVHAGQRGVLTNWGKVTGVVEEGLHFRWWFLGEDLVWMNTQIQKAETEESAASSDLQEATTKIVVNFKLNEAFIETIYTDLRHDYVTRVIQPNMEESLKATTAQFTAPELVTNRSHVKYVFLNTLRERLSIFHIDVIAVSLTDFQFSPEFNAAIEAANTAKQRAIEAKNKLEQIEYEAQQKVIQARANYNATVLNAQATAEKTKLEAYAKAEAIKAITEQITASYINYQALLIWDGKLPYFYGSDAPLPFIFINSTQTK